MPGDSSAFYSDPGFLFFSKKGVLVAQPFSLARLEVSGDAVLVADDIGTATNGGAALSASSNGAISYRSYNLDPARFVWFDRSEVTGSPQSLFKTGLSVDFLRTQYAPSLDGQRFILLLPEQGSVQKPINVILNWAAGLNK